MSVDLVVMIMSLEDELCKMMACLSHVVRKASRGARVKRYFCDRLAEGVSDFERVRRPFHFWEFVSAPGHYYAGVQMRRHDNWRKNYDYSISSNMGWYYDDETRRSSRKKTITAELTGTCLTTAR